VAEQHAPHDAYSRLERKRVAVLSKCRQESPREHGQADSIGSRALQTDIDGGVGLYIALEKLEQGLVAASENSHRDRIGPNERVVLGVQPNPEVPYGPQGNLRLGRRSREESLRIRLKCRPDVAVAGLAQERGATAASRFGWVMCPSDARGTHLPCAEWAAELIWLATENCLERSGGSSDRPSKSCARDRAAAKATGTRLLGQADMFSSCRTRHLG
jgi:hypothetical protein